MIEIQVWTSEGRMLAQCAHEREALLCVDRVYEPGDRIVLSGGAHLWVQMDQALPAGEVYMPAGSLTWLVPAGEHRLAYPPGAFDTRRHVISARAMEEEEIRAVRNIALNPAEETVTPGYYEITAVGGRKALVFTSNEGVITYLYRQEPRFASASRSPSTTAATADVAMGCSPSAAAAAMSLWIFV